MRKGLLFAVTASLVGSPFMQMAALADVVVDPVAHRKYLERWQKMSEAEREEELERKRKFWDSLGGEEWVAPEDEKAAKSPANKADVKKPEILKRPAQPPARTTRATRTGPRLPADNYVVYPKPSVKTGEKSRAPSLKELQGEEHGGLPPYYLMNRNQFRSLEKRAPEAKDSGGSAAFRKAEPTSSK